MSTAQRPRRGGFTLIELLVVIAIISILISLILVASADGVRRAEERQTQALITKLETALTDRVDALLSSSAPINQTHRYLGAITSPDPNSAITFMIPNSFDRRAQAIAQFDFMKAELPDVFYLSGNASYPLNFGAAPYPLDGTTIDAFALPLGNRSPGGPINTTTFVPTPGYSVVSGDNRVGVTTFTPGQVITPDSGIFGASFTAAASLYKNLYEAAALDVGVNTAIVAKRGYDAADNNNNGYIDDIAEVTSTTAAATTFQAAVAARLAKHDHKTARAEMLYALLVEGQGPLGSVYNREDFTSRDVADTDGDGMPEFIDAWGEPLQFYRWPIFYGATPGSSDSQMNYASYDIGLNIARQLDPLDPNQLLTSVGWWLKDTSTNLNVKLPAMVAPATIPDFLSSYNALSPTTSPQANAFMTYFHILIDPRVATPPSNNTLSPNWDRTGATRRRAYYSKFLVLSGGPDREVGVFRLNKDYQADVDSSYSTRVAFPTLNATTDAHLVNWCESQAAPVEYAGRGGAFLEDITTAQASATSLYLRNNAALDDLSNHALTSPGSGAK